jgi:hypothetical protein
MISTHGFRTIVPPYPAFPHEIGVELLYFEVIHRAPIGPFLRHLWAISISSHKT